MDAVLQQDGLDLCLHISNPPQNPHAVSVGIEGVAGPRVDPHQHPVVLQEEWTRLGHIYRSVKLVLIIFSDVYGF